MFFHWQVPSIYVCRSGDLFNLFCLSLTCLIYVQLPNSKVFFLWFGNTRHTLNCSKQKHTSQVTKDWKNFFLHSLTPNKSLGCFNVNFKKSHNLYFILTGLSSIKNCERTFETKLAMTEIKPRRFQKIWTSEIPSPELPSIDSILQTWSSSTGGLRNEAGNHHWVFIVLEFPVPEILLAKRFSCSPQASCKDCCCVLLEAKCLTLCIGPIQQTNKNGLQGQARLSPNCIVLQEQII